MTTSGNTVGTREKRHTIIIREAGLFCLKQAHACAFGIFLLTIILVTKSFYPFESIHRCDFLFFAAVAFQLLMLVLRMESLKEAGVILLFHVLAMGMEIFKTSEAIHSWHYPEVFRIGVFHVPLFVGFMYSAVASYLSRMWRLFDFQFSGYPRPGPVLLLVSLIYINFFTHHFILDIRWFLLVGSLYLFGKSRLYFTVDKTQRAIPLMVVWAGVATCIWVAENIATYSGIWLYPFQEEGWRWVPVAKLMAWFLLMMFSFVLVSVVRGTGAVDAEAEERRPLKTLPGTLSE
jgi:uncharacterized membrane protein YoaT (DUF817 family)